MEIVIQTIRIIDYDNNVVYLRETPEAFSEYVTQLISYINSNKTNREYKTRSINTEVISSVLDIIENEMDSEIVTQKIDSIAERLLIKEMAAQQSIAHLEINVQKGSLIQALLYDQDSDKYIYLLAKVEHTDFVDDSDYSFKSGFSKDKKSLWKSCIFEIDDVNAQEFSAKIYSNTVAKYWFDDFLELNERVSDEVNTEKAFRAIDSTLNRTVKNIAPRDHTVIRNSIIAYFKSNDHIDFDLMLQNIIVSYKPVELENDKMNLLIEKLNQLPEKQKFDRQFNAVSSVINARIRKIYDIYPGIQLKITDAIDDLNDTIQAYRSNDGNKYIRIKTDNELTFKRFSRQE